MLPKGISRQGRRLFFPERCVTKNIFVNCVCLEIADDINFDHRIYDQYGYGDEMICNLFFFSLSLSLYITICRCNTRIYYIHDRDMFRTKGVLFRVPQEIPQVAQAELLALAQKLQQTDGELHNTVRRTFRCSPSYVGYLNQCGDFFIAQHDF